MQDFTKDDIIIDSATVLHEGYVTLRTFTLKHRLFDGGWTSTFLRECVAMAEAVAVILYDPIKQTVLLGKQFRLGSMQESPWLLECVAGKMEPGESHEEVARRESLEEMGCNIDQLIPIMSYYPSPGCVDEKITLYCGLVDSGNKGGVFGLKEENEDISVAVYTLDDALALLRDGKILNVNTIVALQWLQINKSSVASSSRYPSGIQC